MLRSIKTKILVLQLGLVLAVAVTLGIVTYVIMFRSLVRCQQQHLEYIAENIGKELNSLIAFKGQLLEKIAASDMVESYYKKRQENLLIEYFGRFQKHFPVLSYVNEKGLEEFKLVNGTKSKELLDIRDSGFFEDATWNTNKTITSSHPFCPEAGGPYLHFSYCNQNYFDEFIGLVLGKVPIVTLAEDIQQFRFGESGIVAMLGSDGTILSFPYKNRLLNKITIEGYDKEQIVSGIKAMKRGFGRATILGVDSYIAYAPVTGQDWVGVAILPYDEFVAELNTLRDAATLVGLIVLSAGILLSLALADKITQPILKLVEKTVSIAKGDLSQKTDIKSNDEIGILAKSFDKMAEDLRKSTTSIDNLHREIDERRRTEQALRQSEDKYRTLLKNIPQKIFYKDINAAYVLCNKSYADDLKLKSDQIKGKTDYDFYPKELADKYKADDKRIMQSGKAEEIEEKYVKDGQEYTVHTCKSPVRDENGNIIGIFGIFWDITDRKKTETALQESEERFKQVMKSAGDWIWEINAEGLYTYASPVSEKVFGYKPEEIVGKKYFYDFFAPDVREKLKKEAFKVFHRKESFKGFINPNIHKNGDTIILETNGTPILDSNGNLRGYRGADRDVTERKKAEKLLRKNEEFTKRVIESSSDCIKVLDLEGRLLSMSHGGQKLLEIDDMALYLNSSFVDFWKGKEREDCLKAIAKAKQDDTGIFYGYCETAKGTPKSWEVIITPIKDADGSVISLLAVSRDITDRKKAEEALKKLNEDLQSTVLELTRSNKELQEFAYIAAHDLKTPLRAIGTLADWLAKDYSDKLGRQGKEQIDLLITRTRRMDKLVDSILLYTDIEKAGQKQKMVDLNLLLSDIIREINPPDNIEITIENELPKIMCSKAQMTQVFRNLLINAVKYMDKPKGQIRVGCAEENGFWKFSVSDNGPGIEEKYFEKIFKIFQILQPRDETEGIGIGLSLTKKIVELSGGSIWVQSQPGQGSTFHFTLPRQETGAKYEKLKAGTAC